MKFLKLEIKNINSIAEAEIDFANLLAKDEHVFLIWGPSGAGKTTVLDAICLALFKKIPRFEGASDKKDNKYIDNEFRFSESKGREISTNDIRQFLKRGTKEGFCRLTFAGNDQKQYIAQIRFSINKKNTLSEVEWTLQTPNSIFDKNRDIEPEILRTTGLNYEQFCRTTLLAQGEFTKFMKSDQNAKAEILEKLTDTAIFSKIGKRIFEKHRDKDTEFKNIKSQNENIERLTEEQVEFLNDQITQLNAAISALNAERNILNDKKNWFDANHKLKENVESAFRDFKEAKEKASTEEVQKKEHKLRLWESTDTQRKMYSDLIDCNRKYEQYRNKEIDLLSEFEKLSAGNNFVNNKIENAKKALSELQNEQLKYQSLSEILKNSSLIREKLSNHEKLQNKIIENKGNNDKNQVELDKYKEEIVKITQEIDRKSKEIADSDSSLQNLNNEYKSYDYEKLIIEESRLKTIKKDLQEIKDIASTLTENKSQIENQKKCIETCQKTISNCKASLEMAINECAKATQVKDEAQKLYEAAHRSVHDFAKHLRATLKVGDSCPVCGNSITEILTNEAVEASVSKLKEKLEEAVRVEKDKKNNCDSLTIKIKEKEAELEGHKTTIKQLENIKKQQLATMQERCKNVGLVVDKTLLPRIEEKSEETDDIINKIGDTLTKCRNLKCKIDSLKADTDNKNSELKEVQTAKHAKELKYSELEAQWQSLNKQIEDDIETLVTSSGDLDHYLIKFYPDWKENSSKVACNIEESAKKYSEIVKNIELAEKESTTLGENLRRYKGFENRVLEMFGWKSSNALLQCDESENRWNKLIENCSVLSSEINKNNLNKSKLIEELKKYLNSSPEIDEMKLKELVSIGYEVIEKDRKEISDLQNAVHQTEGRWKMANENLKQNNEEKPEMGENDSLETVAEKIKEANKQLDEKNQDVGKIKKQLETDARNREKYAATLARLEEQKRELDKWEHLKNLYGDSEGKKFRKIAQSFILQRLIDSTNYFLDKLSDRYQLTKGHDLLILVNDRYLNSCTRPLDTVSGGESFIISIALALGLSNMAMQSSAPDFIFIDEGISQLDGVRCDNVVSTLQHLHSIINCNIGIVSHLDKLAEMIPTKINVFPISQGTSRIAVERG